MQTNDLCPDEVQDELLRMTTPVLDSTRRRHPPLLDQTWALCVRVGPPKYIHYRFSEKNTRFSSSPNDTRTKTKMLHDGGSLPDLSYIQHPGATHFPAHPQVISRLHGTGWRGVPLSHLNICCIRWYSKCDAAASLSTSVSLNISLYVFIQLSNSLNRGV